MPVQNKVTITINGVKVKVLQGTNNFQNIIGAGVEVGACAATAKLITVTTAAPSQNSTVNPNSSYLISGGEVLTVA